MLLENNHKCMCVGVHVCGCACVGERVRPITATAHTHFCALATLATSVTQPIFIHSYIHAYIQTQTHTLPFMHIWWHFPPAVFPAKHQFFQLCQFFSPTLTHALTLHRRLYICNNILQSGFSLLTSSMCLLPELPFYEYTGIRLKAHINIHI